MADKRNSNLPHIDSVTVVRHGATIELPYILRKGTTGPTVIFIHGLGGAKENFYFAFQSPALADCELLAFDLPGTGLSQFHPSRNPDVSSLAEIVHLAWEALVPRSAFVVAASMGGLISLILVRQHGYEKIRGLMVSATQDMGGGTYTTMVQVASDALGIPVERIHSKLGDTFLPPAPVSGGSMTTASVLPAVRAACQRALAKLIETAARDENSPFHGKKPDEVVAQNGRVFLKGSSPSSGVTYAEVLSSKKLASVEGESFMQPGKEREKYAFQSFGAHFVEVKVDPEIARARVTRVVSAFDVGKVVNPKTARSQGYSGIIMGIGMALMEHTVYDERDGSIVTSNLADYAVPVNADIPGIEVLFVDKPDPYIDDQGIGARGLGEIPITGVAAAVANAIYHATGTRVRDLPITPDKLLSV